MVARFIRSMCSPKLQPSVGCGVLLMVIVGVGLVGRNAALFFVTLYVSGDVLGDYMVGELVIIIASCGDFRTGSTLSSGASRLVLSLIGIGVGEGGRFGTFRLDLPLRLVAPILLGAADQGAGEL